MTADEFRGAEARLGGPTIPQTAELLGISPRMVAGYRSGAYRIPEPVARLMTVLVAYPQLCRMLVPGLEERGAAA